MTDQPNNTLKNSCGAILYAYNKDGILGVILGEEDRGVGDWLPFKGCNENNETYEETAAREIKEETCGVVDIHPSKIILNHKFASKRKNYYIALCEVDYSMIDAFYIARLSENRKEFKEKKNIKFFPLDNVLDDVSVHSLSRASIRYYWNQLKGLSHNAVTGTERVRCHGITESYAKEIINNEVINLNPQIEEQSSSSEGESTTEEISPVSVVGDDSGGVVGDIQKIKRYRIPVEKIKNNSDVYTTKKYSPPLYTSSRKSSPSSYRHPSRVYKPKSNLLSRPKKISINYTPNYEREIENARIWRGNDRNE